MSIAGLLAYVMFIAIGLTSLINANRLWFSVMFLIYLGSICFATVGAVLRRGPARAFWMGFALFGWAFFYYSFHDQTDRMIGNPIILLS